ncbi:MAG: ABC transporter substrate-binding protein, partial [Comamonas sp.]
VLKKKDYDLSLIMHVEPMDIGIYARDDYYFNYNNRVFKKIWEKLRASSSSQELDQWLGQAQKQLAEDAVNAFIVVRPERNFMRKGLVGMWSKCPIPTFALEDLRWQN